VRRYFWRHIYFILLIELATLIINFKDKTKNEREFRRTPVQNSAMFYTKYHSLFPVYMDMIINFSNVNKNVTSDSPTVWIGFCSQFLSRFNVMVIHFPPSSYITFSLDRILAAATVLSFDVFHVLKGSCFLSYD
jgi:hypothetical protein